MTVPKPEGTCRSASAASASSRVHAPTGSPAQLKLGDKGTIGEVRLDDKVTTNVAGAPTLARAGLLDRPRTGTSCRSAPRPPPSRWTAGR